MNGGSRPTRRRGPAAGGRTGHAVLIKLDCLLVLHGFCVSFLIAYNSNIIKAILYLYKTK